MQYEGAGPPKSLNGFAGRRHSQRRARRESTIDRTGNAIEAGNLKVRLDRILPLREA